LEQIKLKMQSKPQPESIHSKPNFDELEPLLYHEFPTPGKYTVKTIKPMNSQHDLALAYSPGVAQPCLEIAKNPADAVRYTNKGNMVAVISNGTAVLGLGNIGALASKPVMEGKSVLFNKFAGVESVDICVDAADPEAFINCVKYLAPSFGGINLEDIKAPDCFEVEARLKELMPIPVFHDDQHGTAIVCLAGFINACKLTDRTADTAKIVLNGAGAAGIACVKLLHNYGVKKENIVICDTQGVCYKGRAKGMNKWKDEFATERPERTLKEALVGADVFIGVSGPNLLTAEDVAKMAKKPLIFAMANPIPEIYPEEARKGQPDAIIATGRSDYPNQINNVMCFPFLFRGTLDAGARIINEEMKMAVALALAELAREPVPQEVERAYGGKQFVFGPDYIMPTPFDPRLISRIPKAVVQAAMKSGVATKTITDWTQYEHELKLRVHKTHY
jgi:malate dehydrogenase (oxaloacetate-decarboxylating)(NADP+)